MQVSLALFSFVTTARAECGGLGVVVAVGSIAVWFMLRHPSPQAVCDQVVQVLPPSATPVARDRMRATCLRDAQPPRYAASRLLEALNTRASLARQTEPALALGARCVDSYAHVWTVGV